MTGWGIHRLRDLIGGHGEMTQDAAGRWVRAVPLPYPKRRWYAAWAVLIGNAYAIHWPQAGELEAALAARSDTGGECGS